jgi:sarcosine oxidase, subunit beta
VSFKLLRYGLNGRRPVPRMWRSHPLKDRYDVVIVGGGAHGLACAYYLAREHGITDVAVLERSYLGAGGSGRNTAIVRSNYLTPEGSAFYDAGVKLYERLSAELDFNVMFSQRGHLTLAHTDATVRIMRRRADVNRIHGIPSRLVFRDELAQLCPQLDLSDRPRYPILAALYHEPGGVIRHDAVVWGYAGAADRCGVHLHQGTEVTGIKVTGGTVVGVATTRGFIRTGTVLNATAGWASTIGAMAGVRLPIVTFPLQACVTEPLKRFLDRVVVSSTLHVYISQSGRGELVMGASVDPFASYDMRGSLQFLEDIAAHMLQLFPCLSRVRIMRQWAGLCDTTPDYSPIMGGTDVRGFLVDVGWGTYGFKASPISGRTMAELIATGKTSPLIAPFRLSRFADRELVGEKGAASVGH